MNIALTPETFERGSHSIYKAPGCNDFDPPYDPSIRYTHVRDKDGIWVPADYKYCKTYVSRQATLEGFVALQKASRRDIDDLDLTTDEYDKQIDLIKKWTGYSVPISGVVPVGMYPGSNFKLQSAFAPLTKHKRMYPSPCHALTHFPAPEWLEAYDPTRTERTTTTPTTRTTTTTSRPFETAISGRYVYATTATLPPKQPTSTVTSASTSRRSAPTSSPGWSPAAKNGRCECRQAVRDLSDRVDTSFQVLTDRLDDLLREGVRPAEPRAAAFDWSEPDRPAEGIPGLSTTPETNAVQIKTEPRSPSPQMYDRTDDSEARDRQARIDSVSMPNDDNADDDEFEETATDVEDWYVPRYDDFRKRSRERKN